MISLVTSTLILWWPSCQTPDRSEGDLVISPVTSTLVLCWPSCQMFDRSEGDLVITPKLVLHWLPCQTLDVKKSVLGLAGLASVCFDWVRQKVGSGKSKFLLQLV